METFTNTIINTQIPTLSGWHWGSHDNSTYASSRRWGNLSNANGAGGVKGISTNEQGATGVWSSILTYYDAGGQLSIPQAEIGKFRVQLGHNHIENSSRFAIRIGADQWFVAGNAHEMSGMDIGGLADFETQHVEYEMDFTTDGSVWQRLEHGTDPVTDPVTQEFSSHGADGVWELPPPETLPEGNITAFGLYNYTRPSSHTRFDDFMVIPGYPVLYDGNAPDAGSPPPAQTKVHGEPLTLASDPGTLVKTGFTLVGWNTLPDGTGTRFAKGAEYTENKAITLFAEWEPLYTVTLHKQGGTGGSDSVEVTVGAAMPAADAPTREGYTFAGYHTSENGIGTQYYDADMNSATEWDVAHDATLHANWTANTYTVTFDGNGGAEPEPVSKPVTFDAAYGALATTSRTGYTFDGWFTAASGGDPITTETLVTATTHHILYAQWSVNQYTITFDSAGGSAVDAITQDFGTAVTAPTNPTKVGYTFTGWSPSVPETMPAENVTLTAQWSVNQYTITFDSNGGSVVDPITQDFGTAVTPPANPTKVGYTFTGWSPAVPETMQAENVTLTAQWSVNQYTITFDSNGGSVVDPITQDFGTEVSPPAAPTKEGHTFSGWDPALPATMPAGNLTLTAQWTPYQYTVTFDSTGGSTPTPATKTVTFGGTYGPLPIVTMMGFTFDKWTLTDDPAAGAVTAATTVTITNDHTLFAQWSPYMPSATITMLRTEVNETDNPTAVWRVSFSGARGEPTEVLYSLDGTATPGVNYVPLSGSVTIPENVLHADIVLTPIHDGIAIENQTLTLTLTSAAAYTISTPGSGTVTILDNDAPPTVTLQRLVESVQEDSAPVTAWQVVASHAPANPLPVTYTVNGTATPGLDYGVLPGTVTIPAGATTAGIGLAPIADDIVDGDETVIVTLTGAGGYVLGTPFTQTVVIVDTTAAVSIPPVSIPGSGLTIPLEPTLGTGGSGGTASPGSGLSVPRDPTLQPAGSTGTGSGLSVPSRWF